MGIHEILANLLRNNYKYDIIAYFYKNPELINDLLELALKDDPKLSWRAAWLFCEFKDYKKHLIEDNQSSIFKILPLRSDNHQRELLKLIYEIEIKEENIALAFDICLKIWKQLNKQPSVRFNSFKVMIRIAEIFPIFHNEIIYYTEYKYIESLSPGAKHSIKKIIQTYRNKHKSIIDFDEFNEL